MGSFMFGKYQLNNGYLSLFVSICIVLAYAVGTLSVHHFLPSIIDFLPNLESSIVLFFGLGLIFLFLKIKRIGLDTIFWILLFLLILIQPLLSAIPYTDALIFPLGMIFGCLLISLAVNNLEDKSSLIYVFACFATLIAVLTVLAQFCQYYQITSSLITYYDKFSNRFYGNVGQVNQTAFILALGLSSIVYLEITQHVSKLYGTRFFLITLFFSLAIGLALTSSRAGLILGGCSFFIAFLNKQKYINKTNKFIVIFVYFLVGFIGYLCGLYALANYPFGKDLNALQRIGDNTAQYRIDLIYQAWLSFKSHPLTGVGLNNFAYDSLNHVNELKWFPFALHSHNVIGQIAAELGILGLLICLIPLYIYIKTFCHKKSAEVQYSLIVVTVFLLYSCSEFPLWFFRYEIVFAMFIAILNTKTFDIEFRVSKVLSAISFIVFSLGVFYYSHYKSMIGISNLLNSNLYDNSSRDELIQRIGDLPNIFGYSDYKERFIFQLIETNNLNIEDKISLGDRVISNFMTDGSLSKLAIFYGLNNQPIESSSLLKSACFLNQYENCAAVMKYIYEIQKNNNQFKPIYNDFNTWYFDNQDAQNAVKTHSAQVLYGKK